MEEENFSFRKLIVPIIILVIILIGAFAFYGSIKDSFSSLDSKINEHIEIPAPH